MKPATSKSENLIPLHGGYRKLKSFQVAQLAYDVTVRFCDRYVEKRSRTHDQMVQAARSGVQNIAEGSQASGTSKKTELKLTNVARASLEELRLDYEDFLRQHGLALWRRDDPRRADLIARRPATAEDVAAWARDVHDGQHGPRGPSERGAGPTSIQSPKSTVSTYPEIAANGALALIAVACSLLDRQLNAQAKAFENEGGFTERLYRFRQQKTAAHRKPQSMSSIPSMKKPWPAVRLGNLVQEEREPVAAFDGNGLPVLGVTNAEGVTQTGVEASDDKSKYLRLRPGRFVYNPYRINVGSIGLSSPTQNGICSPAYVVFAPKENTDALFLLFFLKSARGNQLINFHGNRGTVRSALRFDDLCQIEIPLPPLSEQRRVVARIEELAAQIHEARTLRQQAIEVAEALCRSIVVSDNEATPTPMRDLVALKPPDVSVLPSETYQFAGVYCFGRGVFRSQAKRGMDFAYPRLTRLRTNNFVYPKLMAWEGAFGVVPPECDGCVVSTEFPVFEINEDKVLPEVLDTYFRTPAVWPEVASESTGTNVRRRRLNPEGFLAYKMPLPSRKTQRLLREVRSQVIALKRLQAETAAELDALLPSILDRAFRGEL